MMAHDYGSFHTMQHGLGSWTWVDMCGAIVLVLPDPKSELSHEAKAVF